MRTTSLSQSSSLTSVNGRTGPYTRQMGAREGGTTVFQAEIYAIKSCVMENLACTFSPNIQAAIKALDS